MHAVVSLPHTLCTFFQGVNNHFYSRYHCRKKNYRNEERKAVMKNKLIRMILFLKNSLSAKYALKYLFLAYYL